MSFKFRAASYTASKFERCGSRGFGTEVKEQAQPSVALSVCHYRFGRIEIVSVNDQSFADRGPKVPSSRKPVNHATAGGRRGDLRAEAFHLLRHLRSFISVRRKNSSAAMFASEHPDSSAAHDAVVDR